MSIANEIQRLQSAKADIKSAIEQKGVTVGNGTIDTYAEKISEISGGGGSGDYEQGYEDGKNSVVRLEKYASSMRFENLNLFGVKEVVINFEIANDFSEMCALSWGDRINCATNTTVEHLTISTKAKVRSLYKMFYNSNASRADKTLKRITFNFELDTNYSFNIKNAFQNFVGLEIVDGTPLNVSSGGGFQNVFSRCDNLREIRFVANSIKYSISFSSSANLSADTIQSIIDGLADLTGGTAQTLTLHATVGAKLTDTQKATITAKNWTLVY